MAAATGSDGAQSSTSSSGSSSGVPIFSRNLLETGLRGLFGRRKADEPPPVPEPLKLVAALTLVLGIIDGTCQRTLAVSCPDVESCPPQCIVMGAGEATVNGTFDMKGFRHDSPWYSPPPFPCLYLDRRDGFGRRCFVSPLGPALPSCRYVNEKGVVLSRELADGHHVWVFGRPPSTFFYSHVGEQEKGDKGDRGEAEDKDAKEAKALAAKRPPGTGYRAMASVRVDGRRDVPEDMLSTPEITYNFTHRIRQRSMSTGLNWKGGSRLSFIESPRADPSTTISRKDTPDIFNHTAPLPLVAAPAVPAAPAPAAPVGPE